MSHYDLTAMMKVAQRKVKSAARVHVESEAKARSKISWENATEAARKVLEPFIERYLWTIIEEEILDGVDR